MSLNLKDLAHARALLGGSEGGGEAGDSDDVLNAVIDGSITEISSNATSIRKYAFYEHPTLTTADFPAATSIGDSAFRDCSSLTTADFPAATSIGENAFYGCSALTATYFPVATSIGEYAAFRDCKALTTADFPVATSIEGHMFYNCKALTTADFPVATSIWGGAFYYCSALTSLILRSETMATLSNSNVFTSSGIANGTGYIYVPSALVESYMTATNWSKYASQFRALEDYTVDGTITGELDPNKI